MLLEAGMFDQLQKGLADGIVLNLVRSQLECFCLVSVAKIELVVQL